MPRYKVFVAYGGRYGERIAFFVAECLSQHRMSPRIALPGATGEIQFNSQEEIFEEIGRCDVLVAVNTRGACGCLKFKHEVEEAKYYFRLPVVAFVQKRSKKIHLLRVGVTRVEFNPSQYWRKCDELAFRVRRDILRSRPVRYRHPEKRVARRVLCE